MASASDMLRETASQMNVCFQVFSFGHGCFCMNLLWIKHLGMSTHMHTHRGSYDFRRAHVIISGISVTYPVLTGTNVSF